jgi:hypothetical protein
MLRYRVRLGFGRTEKAVAASFAIALVLTLGALAVSPSLHQRVHTDRARPDHFCLICAFAGGQVSATDTTSVLAVASIFFVYGVFFRETRLVSLLDFYFSPNRAPPRFYLPSVVSF